MYTAIALHKFSDLLRITVKYKDDRRKVLSDSEKRAASFAFLLNFNAVAIVENRQHRVARAKSEIDFGGIAEDRSGSYNKRINYDEKEEGRAMKAAHRRNRNGVFCFHGGVMALDMKISDKEPLICLCFCFREHCPLIDVLIKAGVILRFVEFLDRHDLSQLQFEAPWALTNVASGTSKHTRVVIDHGTVPKLFAFLLVA
ncbi:hypothetical protein KSS87_012396 [Heliosperma pusillum]|nr:hypothetical protein KSS87_012396 [Heliosperma pusillum]